jgi:hypothetical protein
MANKRDQPTSLVDDDFEIPEDLLKPRKRITVREPKSTIPSMDETLYETYGLRPALPFKTKVESLHLVYRLTPIEIGELLNATSGQVLDMLEELQNDWRKLGKPLTVEERELQRGRYIAELDKTIQQIDNEVANGQSDSRSLTLKMNAMERRASLLGLALDKSEKLKEDNTEESLEDEVQRILKDIPPDDLEQMMACLDTCAVAQISGLTSSSPVPNSTVPSAPSVGIPGKGNEPGIVLDRWGLD